MKELTPEKPHVVVMVGIPGAGKTAFASHFAETFNAPFINQYALARDNKLRDTAAGAVTKSMLDELLKTRRTILFEGATYNRRFRDKLATTITKAGYQPLLVWVQTDPTEAKFRATKAHPKGSGLSAEDFDATLAKFEAPLAREHAIVISGKHTYASQLKIVLRQLAAERPRHGVTVPPARHTPVRHRKIQ